MTGVNAPFRPGRAASTFCAVKSQDCIAATLDGFIADPYPARVSNSRTRPATPGASGV